MKKWMMHMVWMMLVLAACQEDTPLQPNTFPLRIRFVNMVGNDTLQLNSRTYTNPFGENFTVEKCLFYATNWSVSNGGVNTKLNDTYFLVNQADRGTQQFQLNSTQQNIDGIRFLLGVDSLRNVSGAQSGALDPLNTMFWTWNSGYIMAKLEGRSPASNQVNNFFEYHIGGFSGPNNVLRTINLPTGNLVLSKDSITEIIIQADWQKLFNGANNLPIAQNPTCVEAGSLAKRYADNYAAMFRILAIRRN